MDPVDKLIANLRKWRGLPGYSVERRLDLLLTPFIPGFLGEVMGGEVELVTAEFPLPKALFDSTDETRKHISADFLCLRRGSPSTWVLVEIKTDASSRRTKQDKAYCSCAAGGMAKILAAIAEKKKDTEHQREYDALVRRLRSLGRGAESVEICYIEPKSATRPIGADVAPRTRSGDSWVDATTGVKVWSFGLGRLARHIGDRDPFARMIQKVLRGIARSDKGRLGKARRRSAA
jgi:hypothetical protein